MNKPVYCFIDDSPFELKLFRDVIEAQNPDIHFVYDTTFSDCQRQLKEQRLYPSLFILDLYGREGLQKNVNIPGKEFLEKQIRKIPDLSFVYDNLEKYNGDKDLQANEFLKRLFSILNQWRTFFSNQCTNLDQGSRYGINNLLQVRKNYPYVTAVIYTRKGLFTDAVALSHYHYDGIYMKPPGNNDKEIYTETRNQAANLMSNWNECVRKGYSLFLQRLNTHKQAVRNLTELLSQDNNLISNEQKDKQKIALFLDSFHTAISAQTEIFSPQANALIHWINYYYALT